jgi:hypothetical protein
MLQKAERWSFLLRNEFTKALCIARFDFAEPITPDKSGGPSAHSLLQRQLDDISPSIRAADGSHSHLTGGLCFRYLTTNCPSRCWPSKSTAYFPETFLNLLFI